MDVDYPEKRKYEDDSDSDEEVEPILQPFARVSSALRFLVLSDCGSCNLVSFACVSDQHSVKGKKHEKIAPIWTPFNEARLISTLKKYAL
jgi:hypothetical protein